jgi:hypothetical protein
LACLLASGLIKKTSVIGFNMCECANSGIGLSLNSFSQYFRHRSSIFPGESNIPVGSVRNMTSFPTYRRKFASPEGRFSCKPISTVFQLIICGLYIDLNEYAAGLASSPETSTGSSVYLRLKGRELRQQGDPHAHRFDGFLSPIFAKEPPQGYPPAGRLGNYRVSDKSILEMSLDQYVECLTKLVERIKASRTLRQPKPFKVVSVTANRLLTFAASGPGIGD